MQYRQLGQTDLKVSHICLGTMTWGKQNTAEDAFAQLEYALSQGVNFIDTAELYAIPPEAATYGATERILGTWLKQHGQRDQIILASKVCGPTAWCPHIREGKAKLDRKNIITACEASLKRLQTDYLDLYQTHWPERQTNYFGKLGFAANTNEPTSTPIEETLRAMEELIASGKVRHVGVSNESAWGVMRHLSAAEQHDLPRIASIQNPYSLLNRSYEVGLAEISQREQTGLLAYSPLAFGTLSGKYLNALPPQTRLALFPHYTRYSNPQGIAATHRYVQLAQAHGLDPAQMALSFVHSRPFVTSTIIGATSMPQLISNLASQDIHLSAEILEGIDAIQKEISNPCP